MTTFSPQTFLTNQGWEGPGSGLRKGSIKKPVTVAHKTNLKGIGKERDTGYAWWDDVFSMVANKKKGGDNPILRKTSTGIHSPLPPGSLSAVSSQPASGSSTPIASTSTSHFHTDLIGHAKLEAARKEFYAKFLRGRPLEGTVLEATEEVVVVEETAIEQVESEDETTPLSKEEKRKQKALRKLEKEERRKLKQEKKDKKSKRKAESEVEGEQSTSVSVEPSPAAEGKQQDLTDSKAGAKKRKRSEGLSEITTPNDTDGVVEVDDASLSKAERKALKAQKKLRKEEKKRRKVEEA